MKKRILFLLCTLSLIAAPPITPKQTAPTITLPKECKTIPPMLIFFPPPMEKELIPCKNAVFLPLLKNVKKKFQTAKKIEIAKGFERLYKITLDHNITIFCNYNLSHCIEGKKLP